MEKKLQMSFNYSFYNEELDRRANIPNPHLTSTGLRLSYDDEEHNSSITSASGSMTTTPFLLSSFGDSVTTYVARKRHSPTVPRTGNSPGAETCTGTPGNVSWTFLDRFDKSTAVSCTVSRFGGRLPHVSRLFPGLFCFAKLNLLPDYGGGRQWLVVVADGCVSGHNPMMVAPDYVFEDL